MAALPHLEAFLPECEQLVRRVRPTRQIDSVVGWGLKPTSKYARHLAASRGWAYLALEDGFLRSVGLGEAGAPPLSLIVDDLGVYYDAGRPSRLENLLVDGRWRTDALISRARALRERIVATGLSKTNASPPLAADVLSRTSRRRVLVIDQTAGDASIAGGLAGPETFARMFKAALRDEPEAEILVRRHPAVAAGLKRGCMDEIALERATLFDQDFRTADILDRVDAVYTVTSLTGFEALMRGLPVRCFGLPFYAGWGITRDEVASPRRTQKRNLDEIFAAAYLLYSRYIDPLTGEAATAEAAVERLIALRRQSDQQAGYTACLGFAPWKHGAARTLLYSPRGNVHFFSSPARAAEAAQKERGRVVFWAGRETSAIRHTLDQSKVPVVRMEDGFIRSRGLGSDFHRASSVVLDDIGVYYDGSRPSRLESLLLNTVFDEATLMRAAGLRQRLVQAGLSKYNLWTGEAQRPVWPKDRFKLLVVGQVENDKSILLGCADIRTNLGLLEAARKTHADAYIVYKPHPDVEAGNRPGGLSQAAVCAWADEIVSGVGIDQCLDHADALCTMTSLTGFEALLRGLPVWTYGRPFYAGWGLTYDSLDCPRRDRRLCLDALVAGALIAYPLYIHPANGLPCEPEDLIAWLENDRRAAPVSEARRLRYWRAIWESFITRPQAHY